MVSHFKGENTNSQSHFKIKLYYFFIYFYQLEANYFTVLQWFLPYSDMNQPWFYMCAPSRSPPPTSLSTRSLWVFPVHQPQALVSCIQPGLVICFTLDSILVSVLFSQIIPPSPSPTESKSLFCIKEELAINSLPISRLTILHYSKDLLLPL